jgi:hypothetical protein
MYLLKFSITKLENKFLAIYLRREYDEGAAKLLKVEEIYDNFKFVLELPKSKSRCLKTLERFFRNVLPVPSRMFSFYGFYF